MECQLGGSYYNHQLAVFGYRALEMVVRCDLKGRMTEDISSIPVDAAKYNGKFALDCNFLLKKGSDETIAEIRGIEEIESIPCCVELQKLHGVGYYYVKDRTADKPIANAEIVVNSKKEVIEKVNYINNTFDVFNKGHSPLITKMNTKELFK